MSFLIVISIGFSVIPLPLSIYLWIHGDISLLYLPLLLAILGIRSFYNVKYSLKLSETNYSWRDAIAFMSFGATASMVIFADNFSRTAIGSLIGVLAITGTWSWISYRDALPKMRPEIRPPSIISMIPMKCEVAWNKTRMTGSSCIPHVPRAA